MIIDKENLFSYKQAITASAVSTDVLDLGPPMHTKTSGHDKELPVFMHVDEAFLADGAATLVVGIQSSSVEDFGSDVTTHVSTPAIPKADLAQPKKMSLSLNLPPDVKRYVRANYTVATGPFTAGKITCGLTASRQINS